jgi:Ca-activated chloride channel family protein
MTPEMRQLAWTAGLTAGALVLLYLLRPRRRRVEVPFGGLWQRVLAEQQARAFGTQWRRWLSLLLMLAIAALLVGALAEPMWRTAQDKARPVLPVPHVVLIVDRSASMATRDGQGLVQPDGLPPSRLQQALEQTWKLVQEAPLESQFLLLAASGHAEVLAGWGSDRAALKKALDGLQPLDGGLDLLRAHASAKGALAGRSQGHLVLVSDDGPPLAELPADATPLVEHVHVGPKTAQPLDDLAVLEVRIRPDAGDPDRGTLTVLVRNASARTIAGQLLVSASASAQAARDFATESALRRVEQVQLPPGISTHALAGVDLLAPRFAVRVRAQDLAFRDRAPFDDVGYAVLAERKEVHVLLVGDTAPDKPGLQPNAYLLAALQASDRVRVQTLDPAAYDPKDYAAPAKARHGIDVVLLDQVEAELPPGTPGLRLLLRPAASDKKAWLQGPEIVVRSGDHPLMYGVSFQDTNFDTVRVIKPLPGDVVLAAARPNGAVMVARQGTARSIEWGLDLAETDLVARYALPILLGNAIAWLTGVDQPLVVPLELGRAWAIETPSEGQAWTWQVPGQLPRPARTSGSQLLASSEVQGVHVWMSADGKEIARPTALPAGEDPAALRLPTRSWRTLPARPLAVTEGDRPVWALLLLAALAILALEWWTYLRRRTV